MMGIFTKSYKCTISFYETPYIDGIQQASDLRYTAGIVTIWRWHSPLRAYRLAREKMEAIIAENRRPVIVDFQKF